LAVALAAVSAAAAGKHAHRGFRVLSTASQINAVPAPASPAEADKGNKQTPFEAMTAGTTFKMPNYHHADSLSAATDGYLDWFVVIYWGAWIMVVVLVELVTHLNGGIPVTHAHVDDIVSVMSAPSVLDGKRSPSPGADDDTPSPRSPPERLALKKSLSLLDEDDDPQGVRVDLAPNMWTLSVVSARGMARKRSNRDNILSPKLVFVGAIAMGLLQIFTLFLVVYDVDPSASPYTTTPSAAWKTSPFTVNAMKFVMVFFLGMSVVAEAGDAYDNYIIGMGVNIEELLIHKFFVLFIPLFHYIITLVVILAGVSVILSCQAVPEILYNSMAILFITQVDELFWGFFERTFDIEADWSVYRNESHIPEVELLKKCIIMFPMLWGFCLLGRAWYRDQMPALIVRVLAKPG